MAPRVPELPALLRLRPFGVPRLGPIPLGDVADVGCCAKTFLAALRPALSRGDADEVAQAVNGLLDARELAELLQHNEPDVRRVAAFVTGLVGDRCAVGPLSRLLHDYDETVVKMAEHGLWSVWFRDSTAEAAEPFARGVEMLADERLDEALLALRRASELDPDLPKRTTRPRSACI